jgi:O-antigen/teichoic acid export membrane protein
MRLLNMVLAAVLGILTARALGPDGRGIYAMPMVNAGLVSAGFAGITSGVSFYLLREGAGRSVLRPTFLTAVALFLAGAGISTAAAYFAHAMWSALPAVLSLPASLALMIGGGYATGTRRVRAVTSQAVLSTVLMILFIGAGFLIFGRAPSVAIVGWIAGANALGIGILIWVLWDARKLPHGEDVPLIPYIWYTMRSASVNLVSLLNYRADIYIVALLGTPQMLGMYTVAVSAAETLLKATQVTAIVATPHVGSMEIDRAAALTARCVRHNVIVAGVCSVGLAIFSPLAVQLLYGAAFLPMVPALRILLLGVFALSLGSPMSSFFTIRLGRPEVALTLASVSAAICIALCFLLVPVYGLAGAAWASTAAYIFAQATAIRYFSVTTGITMSDVLLPKVGDISVYLSALGHLGRRGSIDSAG